MTSITFDLPLLASDEAALAAFIFEHQSDDMAEVIDALSQAVVDYCESNGITDRLPEPICAVTATLMALAMTAYAVEVSQSGDAFRAMYALSEAAMNAGHASVDHGHPLAVAAFGDCQTDQPVVIVLSRAQEWVAERLADDSDVDAFLASALIESDSDSDPDPAA